MTPTPEELYQQREQRFNNIVALKKPDRVPVVPIVNHYFPTKIAGVSNRDAGYDYETRYRCMKEATIRFGWDFATYCGVPPSGALEALAMKQIRWPGGDLADDAPFQFVEGEYIKADEADAFLADPSGFALSTVLPRVAGAFGVLGQAQIPPLHWVANGYLPQFLAPVFAAPPVGDMFKALGAMCDDVARWFGADVAYWQEMAALGYPQPYMGIVFPAFDAVSDYFRSLRGGTLDMFRQPDKLLQMIDVMLPSTIGMAIGAAQATGNPRVFIPMHRGAAGFMSDEQFAKFYWPSFAALIHALVDAGLTPCPLFEGDYTPRLKYLAQLPAGKIAAHFDKVDRKQFKEICGDTMCFWGNVPASLLATGSPDQVKQDVRELVELFSDSGALIIDGTMGIPDESRPENVAALAEAAQEYGIW